MIADDKNQDVHALILQMSVPGAICTMNQETKKNSVSEQSVWMGCIKSMLAVSEPQAVYLLVAIVKKQQQIRASCKC